MIFEVDFIARSNWHEHWHCDGESEREINIPKEEPNGIKLVKL